ncbi:MAG TPA: phosphatase PAP2 family protein [Chthoniobacteraceae bacterium]|jgi:undecaprenyl-diphosphatase
MNERNRSLNSDPSAMNWSAKLLNLLRKNGRWDLALLLIVSGLTISVWVFAEVADEVLEGGVQVHEEQFMRSLRSPHDAGVPIGPKWLRQVAQDVTALGGVTVLSLVTLLVLNYLVLQRMVHAAWLVIVATGGGLFLTLLLKQSFGRERPGVVPHLTEVLTASFPSGHSMLSSVVYLTLGALLARAVSRRTLKVYFLLTALFLSFIIGLSRVYLGVHYPSDVLAGWAGGTAWALLCWTVARWLQHRGAVEPSPPEPAAEVVEQQL